MIQRLDNGKLTQNEAFSSQKVLQIIKEVPYSRIIIIPREKNFEFKRKISFVNDDIKTVIKGLIEIDFS